MAKYNDEIIPLQSLYYKSRYMMGKTAIFIFERFLALFIKRSIFFPEKEFEWVGLINKGYPTIKGEFEKVFLRTQPIDVTELSAEQYKVIKPNQWHSIPLYFYGYKIDAYCSMLPETTALVEIIPNMTTAFFSTLKPRTHIAEHRGAYRGFLRYHLGINTPADFENCRIYFNSGKVSYAWQNGKSVIFDDTFQHYVKNETDETRTVLYVDFIRPMPKFMFKISLLLLSAFQRSPYVQNFLFKLKQLDENHSFQKIKYQWR